MRSYCSIFLISLLLSACGSDPAEPLPADAPTGATQSTPPTEAPAEPMLVDGVQVVEIEAGPIGYQPREITLEADVPARLVFTRTVDSECSSQVQIPAFDVPLTDLPMNEPVAVEFTPTESGDFEFVCGMDMQLGSLLIQS